MKAITGGAAKGLCPSCGSHGYYVHVDRQFSYCFDCGRETALEDLQKKIIAARNTGDDAEAAELTRRFVRLANDIRKAQTLAGTDA